MYIHAPRWNPVLSIALEAFKKLGSYLCLAIADEAGSSALLLRPLHYYSHGLCMYLWTVQCAYAERDFMP